MTLRSEEVPQATTTPPTARGHASPRLNDPGAAILSSKPPRRAFGKSGSLSLPNAASVAFRGRRRAAAGCQGGRRRKLRPDAQEAARCSSRSGQRFVGSSCVARLNLDFAERSAVDMKLVGGWFFMSDSVNGRFR